MILIINIKLNYLMVICWIMSISLRVDQQNEIKSAYFGNQSSSLFASCCYFKNVTNEIRNKSAVELTENSYHNRIT